MDGAYLPCTVVFLGSWSLVEKYARRCYSSPMLYHALSQTSIDDPRIPLHLLVYAVQTTVTTTTCIADFLSWSSYENAQKLELLKLYVPYLALRKYLGSLRWLFEHADNRQPYSWELICLAGSVMPSGGAS
jgi:hypothetical protein